MVYLKSLEIEGLYSFGERVKFDLSDNTVVVGPNNSGKTNIFKVIDVFVDTFSQQKHLDKSKFSTSSSDASLSVFVKLSEEETHKIIDFLAFYNDVKGNVGFCNFDNKEILLELFDEIDITLSWEKQIDNRGSIPEIKMDFNKIGLMFFSQGGSELKIYHKFYDNTNSSNYEDLLVILKEIKDDGEKFFMNNFSENKIQGWVEQSWLDPIACHECSTDARETLRELLLFLERNADAHGNIIFLNILGKIFSNGIKHSAGNSFDYLSQQEFVQRLQRLARNSYPGNTLEKSDDFLGKLTELLVQINLKPAQTLTSNGSNLSNFLFSLKNSPELSNRRRFASIKKEFNEILGSYGLEFDISLRYQDYARADDSDPVYSAIPTLPTIVFADKKLGVQFEIDGVGSGILEVIYLLSASHGLTNSLILLDEPYAKIHPSLTKSLIDSTKGSDNQIITITHLPDVAKYEIFEKKSNIAYLRKNDKNSIVKQFDDKTKTWFEEKMQKSVHQIDPQIFFANGVVLVEGSADKNLFDAFATLVESTSKINFGKSNNIVVDVGGKTFLEKSKNLLQSLGIPHVIICDWDVAEFEEFGTISDQDIEHKNNIFKIAEPHKDLEGFAKSLDPEIYKKVNGEHKKFSPAGNAFTFAEEYAEKNPDLKLFKKLFKSITEELNRPSS